MSNLLKMTSGFPASRRVILCFLGSLFIASCSSPDSNDVNFKRTAPTAKFLGFQGGDIRGVIRKIEEGYFDRLGITLFYYFCLPEINS